MSVALAGIGSWMGMSLGNGGGKGPDSAPAFIRTGGGSDKQNRNLSNVIFPQSNVQARIDLDTWIKSLEEAEIAGYPYRVAMQQMYLKTRLNPHVAACMQRRKELTLLRDFHLQGSDGKPNKKWTEFFEKAWFKHHIMELILDAQYYGYTLISIGEITENIPSEIISVKRWNVSPDRKHVSVFPKSPAGYRWDDPEYADWHIWVPTPQPNGVNGCGYGLLYPVAALEILQRNNVQYNTDFIEMFAQPYRHLKTNETDENELNRKEKAMSEMGHSAYLITGTTDELEFLTDGSRGNGYKAYNDFDHRTKSDISKLIGGHANFIDSTTEPLAGGSQNSGGGDPTRETTGSTQVQMATAAKRMIDGDFVTNIVNESLIPKLRNLGVNIPNGLTFKFLNDTEERIIAAQEADKNQKIATLALTMAQGGLKMDGEQFTELTGIKCTEVAISPDKNVVTETKKQATGADPLKDESMKREDKPKHTEGV